MTYTKLYKDKYPDQLKRLETVPPFLYHAGSPVPSNDYKFLCVVGSRNHDDYGREVCNYLIRGLRGYPIVIVSGLALGIDSLAHIAALDNGLPTIAIPGSGLTQEVIYPRSHYLLAERIIMSGNTLLSPFGPEQRGDYWTFPVRNQLMAAISDATLIIEGGVDSGTLITADHALAMNRDVMVVPGSIYSPLSYGPHKLLKQGATPVTTPGDVLNVLEFFQDEDSGDRMTEMIDKAFRELPQDQLIVLRELQFKPCTSTELIEKLGISTVHFSRIATELELYGIVKESNGVYKIATNM